MRKTEETVGDFGREKDAENKNNNRNDYFPSRGKTQQND